MWISFEKGINISVQNWGQKVASKFVAFGAVGGLCAQLLLRLTLVLLLRAATVGRRLLKGTLRSAFSLRTCERKSTSSRALYRLQPLVDTGFWLKPSDQGSNFTPEVNGDSIKCDQSISGGYL